MTQKNTFDEDEALTLAERTFSTEIDEQLASDIIKYASRLLSSYLVNQQPTSDVGVQGLVTALEEVIDPIPYMKKRLEVGERLNGLVAVQLAEDAEYLRDIAYKAITTYREQKGDI